MRILILNWRDIKNPTAGGAEILTHEMAKRWVKAGHTVFHFTAQFPGSKQSEEIEGVQIVRRGSWWTVHVWAFLYYMVKFKKNIDVIIDEVHWFPFFSRLYARDKTILLVCEVANKLFSVILSQPFASIGQFIEKCYLWIYKNAPTLAISPSTQQDLIQEGFHKESITILPMGVNVPADVEYYRSFPKESIPTLVYLSRINKQKGAEDAIYILKYVQKKIPGTRLWFVGKGTEEFITEIKSRLIAMGLDTYVTFYGFVSEMKKFELLARAHILLVPSTYEGWGLIVPEANSVGTPAVVYNVSGLKDVVINNVTGITTIPQSDAMANAAISLFIDKRKYQHMYRKAIEQVKLYDWNTTAKVALKVITSLRK